MGHVWHVTVMPLSVLRLCTISTKGPAICFGTLVLCNIFVISAILSILLFSSAGPYIGTNEGVFLLQLRSTGNTFPDSFSLFDDLCLPSQN